MDLEFAGRRNELARLNAHLQTALNGAMQVCLVVGKAGTGKSSLLVEFSRQAQNADDTLVLVTGNCNAQSGISDPYLPFRHILGILMGDETRLANNAMTASNVGRVRRAVKTSARFLLELAPDLIGTLIPGSSLAVTLARMGARERGLLKGLDELVENTLKSPRDIEQAQIFLQFTALLHSIANEYPLVIVLDDLHWIDTASNSLFFHLIRELSGCRILIVGLYRSTDVAAGRNGGRHPLEATINEIRRAWGEVRIDLDTVSETDRRAFINELLDSIPNHFDKPFRDELYTHTGGQALFTTELLRNMQESGELVQDLSGRWHASRAIDWNQLPAKVEGIIAERVERLADELQGILETAAVEGVTFTAQVLAQVQNLSFRQLVTILSHELERRHRLVRELAEQSIGHSIISRYAFDHVVTQVYVYNRLGAAECRLLHGEIADALEDVYGERADAVAVQLAYHYTEAQEHDKALIYLRMAGDHAFTLGAFIQAREFYARAIEQVDVISVEGRAADYAYLYWRLGDTYYYTGFKSESEDHFRRSVAFARQANWQDQVAQSLIDLAHSLPRRDFELAREYVDEALTIARQSANRALEGNAVRVLGVLFRGTDDTERRIEATERARLIALEIGDISLEMACLRGMSYIYGGVFGNYPMAIEYLENALRLASQHRFITMQLSCSAGLAIYRRVGDYKKARETLGRTLSLLNQLGNGPSTAASLLSLGIVELHEGDLPSAIETWNKCIEIAEQYDRLMVQVDCRRWLILIYLMTDELDLVRRLINAQAPQLERYRSKVGVCSERLLEGIFLLRSSQVDEARTIFQYELEVATETFPTERWAYRYHRSFAQAGLVLTSPLGTRGEEFIQTEEWFRLAVEYCGWAGILDDALLVLRVLRKSDSENVLQSIEDELSGKREIAWHNWPLLEAQRDGSGPV